MSNKILWAFTTADAEEMLGRELREGEEARIAKAIEHSTIHDTIDAVMFQFSDPADSCEGEGDWPVQRDGEHIDDYNVRMEAAMFGEQDADLGED